MLALYAETHDLSQGREACRCLWVCHVTHTGDLSCLRVCARLYSSAFFNDTFPEHTPPEIVNSPLEGVVLTMKSIGIDKVQTLGICMQSYESIAVLVTSIVSALFLTSKG